MEFSRPRAIVGAEPVFATDLLLAGAVDAEDVRPLLDVGADPAAGPYRRESAGAHGEMLFLTPSSLSKNPPFAFSGTRIRADRHGLVLQRLSKSSVSRKALTGPNVTP